MASSSSNSSSWMPPKGRYPVNIGTSLGRAIKQRKSKGSPAATAKKSNLPEREFYSFKFGFKASSIDTTRPATIEIKKGSTETNQVTAEYPSTQPGEVHIFTGQEQKAKEVDCVLIFDEETGVFTLEKIDSSLHLKFDRKQAVSHEGSPVAAATPASTSSSKDVKREVDVFEDILPSKRAVKQEEEEDEDEELPLRQVVTHKAQPARPPPKAIPPSTKPAPKARPEPKAPPPAASPPPPARSKAPPAQSQPQPKSQPRPPPPSAPPPQAKVPLPSPQSKPKPPPPLLLLRELQSGRFLYQEQARPNPNHQRPLPTKRSSSLESQRREHDHLCLLLVPSLRLRPHHRPRLLRLRCRCLVRLRRLLFLLRLRLLIDRLGPARHRRLLLLRLCLCPNRWIATKMKSGRRLLCLTRLSPRLGRTKTSWS
ncbi:hypothetical protein CPC08DRAFT_819424 [Agrocybe pediades]|nr:hypothetical protein CPC08DRAFT_819424 [Agrocybe pediades]